MADEVKPPVAIRITRPYATEDEFIEKERDTLTRTSVILLGAQPRPQGVILRFEIILTNGASVLRGEGRVVGFKPTAQGGEPGLTLRFTRLDSRSKALVDRAAALREARRSSNPGMQAVVAPRSPVPPPLPPQPIPESRSIPQPLESVPQSLLDLPTGRSSSVPPPEVLASDVPESVPPSIVPESLPPSVAPPLLPKTRSGPPPLPAWARSGEHRAVVPPMPAQAPLPPRAPFRHEAAISNARTLDAPSDRAALLERLRDRARSLPAARVAEILAKRADA